MKRLSLIIAVVLAGCGGSSHDVPQPPPVQLDAFFAAVSGVIASSPDDAEGVNVETMAPTAPDGNDPEPL